MQQQSIDHVRVELEGVRPDGCPDAAQLNGDYLLAWVERRPDRMAWELEFPAQCGLQHVSVVATRNASGGYRL